MALESSGARAEQLARQIIVHGRPVPMDEVVAKIDAVTAEEVQALAVDFLARPRCQVQVVPAN